LAVRTFHSNSGLAKEILAVFCGLPDLAAASASASAVSGARTSSVTVFIEDSPYVALKISEEPIQGGEPISTFCIDGVPMVPFARFVVVAQDTDAVDDERQAVLV
jgi:hypothetical protein